MFLALDSVFNQCSVALLSADGAILNQQTQGGKRAQTQQILPMIESTLAHTGVKLNEITALIFNRGPGAFSGIRINTAVVQALSVAHDIPCVGLSSLQVIAQAALEQYGIEACYSVHDARMKQVYIGRFAVQTDTGTTAIMQPKPVSVADSDDDTQNKSCEQLVDYDKQTALKLPLVGDGAALLQVQEGQQIICEVALDASILARLGIDTFNKQGGVPAEHALPVYLRNHAWKTLKEQGKA